MAEHPGAEQGDKAGAGSGNSRDGTSHKRVPADVGAGEKISAVGRHIRDDLSPRLKELTSVQADVFGWESAHRRDARRRPRKRFQLAVDLMTFCGAPLAALAVYWLLGPTPWPLLLCSLAETTLVIGLAVQVVRYAELEG
ncbi:hypothetical protein ACWFRM_11265 [Streptomyces sp. NPDC055144]